MNMIDKKGRIIDSDKLFIYAGRANMSLNPTFFKKALKGGYPKGGKRYTVDEFFNYTLPCTGYESIVDLTSQTNSNYEGFQTIQLKEGENYDWWLYYVSIEKLSGFNRIEKDSNTPEIAGRILRAHEFRWISWATVYGNNLNHIYEFYKDIKSKKIVIIESSAEYDKEHDCMCIPDIEQIHLLLPSEFADKGYSYCNTINIFFDSVSKDPTSGNMLQYTEKTWDDVYRDNNVDNLYGLTRYIMEDFLDKNKDTGSMIQITCSAD